MKRLLFPWVIALLLISAAGFANAEMYWEGEPEDATITQEDFDVDFSVPKLKNTLFDKEIYDDYERMDVDPPSLNVEPQRPAAVESDEEETEPARTERVTPGRPVTPAFDRVPSQRTTPPARDSATTPPRTTVTTTPRPAETSPGSTPSATPATPSGAGKPSPDVTAKPPAGEKASTGNQAQPVTKRMQWGQPGGTTTPANETPKFQWGQPKSDQR